MRRSTAIRAALLRTLPLLLLLVEARGARADRVLLRETSAFEVEAGARRRVWTLKKDGSEDATLSEWVLPLAARRPLGARGEIAVSLPSVLASMEGEGSSEYRGLADATLAGSVRLGAGMHAAATLGVPSGESKTAGGEAELAGAVANRVLGLPVKRFGEGWSAGASLVRAFPLSRALSLSAGAGFLWKGEYVFVGSGGADETYDSGDEIFFTAGAGGEWGSDRRGFRASVDARYRTFGMDRRGGRDYFEEGDEVDLLLDAGAFFAPGRKLDLRAFLAFKGEGSERGAFASGSLDSLSLERYLLRGMNGNDQELSAAYTHRLAAWLEVVVRGLVGNFGEYPVPGDGVGGERLLGSGRVYEAGGGFRIDVLPGVRVHLDAAGLSGEVEGGAVDLSGTDLSAAVRWSF